MDMKSALVLLSGGQDSTTCLAWARHMFPGDIHTIAFNYGQRHSVELDAGAQLSSMIGARTHKIVDFQEVFRNVTSSRLMEKESPIGEQSEHDPSLPASFVPYRNVFFLTAAAAHAYLLGLGNLVTGICQTDYSGYPDCRNEFAKAINTALTLASAKPLEVHTPLMWLTKAETVRLLATLGELQLLAYSHTCYNGKYPPCGECPSCQLRAKGFEEAGVPDPLISRAMEEGLLPNDSNPYTGK